MTAGDKAKIEELERRIEQLHDNQDRDAKLNGRVATQVNRFEKTITDLDRATAATLGIHSEQIEKQQEILDTLTDVDEGRIAKVEARTLKDGLWMDRFEKRIKKIEGGFRQLNDQQRRLLEIEDKLRQIFQLCIPERFKELDQLKEQRNLQSEVLDRHEKQIREVLNDREEKTQDWRDVCLRMMELTAHPRLSIDPQKPDIQQLVDGKWRAEEENKHFRAQIERLEKELGHEKAGRINNERIIQKLREQVQRSSDNNARLQQELADAKRCLTYERQENENLRSQENVQGITLLKSTINVIEKHKAELKESCERANKLCNSRWTKLKESEETIRRLDKECDRLRDLLADNRVEDRDVHFWAGVAKMRAETASKMHNEIEQVKRERDDLIARGMGR